MALGPGSIKHTHKHIHPSARERAYRKRWLLEKIKATPGNEVNLLWVWFTREFGLTKRKFQEYLSELEEEHEIKILSGRAFPILIEEEETSKSEVVQSRWPTPRAKSAGVD